MATQLNPKGLFDVAFSFMASRTVLSAVELGVFGVLGQAPMPLDALSAKLKLHPRSARDFLDALVALKFLTRDDQGLYANTPETAAFLDPAKPEYVGGMIEMASRRLYGFWDRLPTALRTGELQNEVKDGLDLFDELYKDPDRLEVFLGGMSAISTGPARALAARFPWTDYKTFADVGCAQGVMPVTLASAHPHLRGIGYDLAAVRPVFERFVTKHGLSQRVTFQAGSFFTDPLPDVDVLIMGHILHDWNLEQKNFLIAAAYKALKPGGVFIAYDAMIDDARRENVEGLMMSLNMLIETRSGFDYTGADSRGWFEAAGFKNVRTEPLSPGRSMTLGTK